MDSFTRQHFVSHRSFVKSLRQSIFSNLYWGWSGGGPIGSAKCSRLCCYKTERDMHDKKLSGKIVASRRVPKKPPPTKCQSHICCNLTSVFFWKELWTGILWTWAELVIGQKKTGIKIGYTWIGTKKKWNKNMAKKIATTIDRETDLKFTI